MGSYMALWSSLASLAWAAQSSALTKMEAHMSHFANSVWFQMIARTVGPDWSRAAMVHFMGPPISVAATIREPFSDSPLQETAATQTRFSKASPVSTEMVQIRRAL